MKKISSILSFIILICNISCLFAQTPADCSANLKNALYAQIGIQQDISYAKSPFPVNCKDVVYAGDAPGSCSHPSDDCLNSPASLIYDVYYPVRTNTSTGLPAVILFHGGGFAECPGLDQHLMTVLCSTFAERGFVTFNVEYRRGRLKDNRNPAYVSVQHQLAAYRALQDCRGAIRSIIKRQQLHNNPEYINDPYQIDLDNVFIGGVSAGALMTVTAAWYTNPMIYQAFPSPTGQPTIQDALGTIDPDYYFGEPSIAYKPHVKGVVSMWGAVAIPYSYNTHQQDFFTQTNYPATLKPVIAFHGKQDLIFPFDTDIDPSAQNIIFSPTGGSTNYNSDTRCLLNSNFTLDGDGAPDLISASSLNIYNIAKSINSNLPIELYVDCEMGHGLDNDGPNFKSNFGTPYYTADQVTVYIVQRAAIFFQAIMNSKIASDIGPPSKFTECINFRVKCNGPGTNCSDSDSCPASE